MLCQLHTPVHTAAGLQLELTFSSMKPGTPKSDASPLRAMPMSMDSLNIPNAFCRRRPALSAVPCKRRANVMHATPARRAAVGDGVFSGWSAWRASGMVVSVIRFYQIHDHLHSPNTEHEAACHPCQ